MENIVIALILIIQTHAGDFPGKHVDLIFFRNVLHLLCNGVT